VNTRRTLLPALFALALALVHFFVSPLDVMWFRGMRKVDQVIGE
jgi:hypothetical protein